jgi:hypothetical protein
MNIEEKRKCWGLCEICGKEPITNIKGGIYNNESKMWMVCKKCLSKIEDRRLR